MVDAGSAVRARRVRRGAAGGLAAIVACIACCAVPLVAGASIGSVIACSALLLGATLIGGVAVIATVVFVVGRIRSRKGPPPESVPVEWRVSSP